MFGPAGRGRSGTPGLLDIQRLGVGLAPGTGKTHLGIAIAAQVVKSRRRVRFDGAVDLVNPLELELEKAAAKQGCLAYRRMHTDVVLRQRLLTLQETP